MKMEKGSTVMHVQQRASSVSWGGQGQMDRVLRDVQSNGYVLTVTGY